MGPCERVGRWVGERTGGVWAGRQAGWGVGVDRVGRQAGKREGENPRLCMLSFNFPLQALLLTICQGTQNREHAM